MKTAIVLVLAMLVIAPAASAQLNPPANGIYKSTDVGGTMLTGRYSESYIGGAKLSPGNTVHEQSWDGATLGTQWKWFCAYQVGPPILQQDTVDGNGDGTKIWQVEYTSGQAWLSGTGPWAGGDPFYTAQVDTWVATVTEQFAAGVEVATVKTVNASAQFDNYTEACIVLSLSNFEKLGEGMVLPANYPEYIDQTCAPVAGPGEWGEVDDITYAILGCTVSTEKKSWGAVKQLYR